MRWLKYWVVYAIHLLVGAESEQLLRWIPLLGFRHHIHLLMLVWLQLPYFRGATTIYDRAGGVLGQMLFGTGGAGGIGGTSLAHRCFASNFHSLAALLLPYSVRT